MAEFLKNLQNKPEATKKMIMWTSICFIMLAIFVFWLLTFPSQTQKIGDNEATADLKKELPGVWQSIKDQVNNLQDLWQK